MRRDAGGDWCVRVEKKRVGNAPSMDVDREGAAGETDYSSGVLLLRTHVP